jgi:hypothetical protein
MICGSCRIYMNKTKLQERIDNAVSSFFESAPDRSHFELTYTGHEGALAAGGTFSEKAGKWLGVLREILLFGPGTFSLFYLTLTIVFFYPTLGIGFYGFLMFMFAVFMTYAGSGSIYRPKNLAVPATVIATALGVVFISLFFAGNELADIYFGYSIYLFPFVLIAAKLVQRSVAD